METISAGREYDRRQRILIMEGMGVMMRIFTRTGEKEWLDLARGSGEIAKQLSERIKNHDYSVEDGEWERCNALEKAWQKLVRESVKAVPVQKTMSSSQKKWNDEVNRKADKMWEELFAAIVPK